MTEAIIYEGEKLMQQEEQYLLVAKEVMMSNKFYKRQLVSKGEHTRRQSTCLLNEDGQAPQPVSLIHSKC